MLFSSISFAPSKNGLFAIIDSIMNICSGSILILTFAYGGIILRQSSLNSTLCFEMDG
jgi:hypothetical protein